MYKQQIFIETSIHDNQLLHRNALKHTGNNDCLQLLGFPTSQSDDGAGELPRSPEDKG